MNNNIKTPREVILAAVLAPIVGTRSPLKAVKILEAIYAEEKDVPDVSAERMREVFDSFAHQDETPYFTKDEVMSIAQQPSLRDLVVVTYMEGPDVFNLQEQFLQEFQDAGITFMPDETSMMLTHLVPHLGITETGELEVFLEHHAKEPPDLVPVSEARMLEVLDYDNIDDHTGEWIHPFTEEEAWNILRSPSLRNQFWLVYNRVLNDDDLNLSSIAKRA